MGLFYYFFYHKGTQRTFLFNYVIDGFSRSQGNMDIGVVALRKFFLRRLICPA